MIIGPETKKEMFGKGTTSQQKTTVYTRKHLEEYHKKELKDPAA
jgi:hypothetical protein